MSEPLISIVIPYYNQPAYLEECLQSILAQTYQNWEALVVDDASPHAGGAALVERLGDPRVKFLRHERNRGQGAARNTGITAAAGELVLPVDSDDKLDATYLQKVAPLLIGHPEHTAAFPNFYTFGARDTLIKYRILGVYELLLDQWVPGAGTLFYKKLWQQVGGYDETDVLRANEDWDFWLGVAEHGLSIAHLAEPLYFYRQHSASISIPARYWEYAARESMYRRHRHLYDRYRAGARFRAEGYRRSAVSAWQRGERGRAARLALHGWRLAPGRFTRASLRPLRRALRR